MDDPRPGSRRPGSGPVRRAGTLAGAALRRRGDHDRDACQDGCRLVHAGTGGERFDGAPRQDAAGQRTLRAASGSNSPVNRLAVRTPAGVTLVVFITLGVGAAALKAVE